MRTRSMLLLAGLAAALLLALAVGSASARRISITNRQFRIVWRALRAGTTGGIEIACPVTFEGSFHSFTIHKVTGALVGNITRATLVPGSCTGGRVTIGQEALPWHVRWNGFSGTLPSITLVLLDLIGAKFTSEASGATCTTQTTSANPGRARIIVEASGGGREISADPNALIPLRSAFLCEFAGEVSDQGTGTITLLGNTTTITIRLI